MPRKSVEQQPSTTALFTALRRALAYLEYKNEKFGADSLSIYFLPPHYRFFLKFPKVRTNTKRQLDEALPGMNAYVIARTAFFDHLFVEALKNKTPQIVLLGAGYDSRAYRFASENHQTRVYELDIAPTQNRKKTCLKKAHVKIPPQVMFVPINFNQDALADVLQKAGYQHGEKTLFIWEGVSYYLDPQSVDATLAWVSQSSGESMIAFDYMVLIPRENLDQVYGLREFDLAMKGYHQNEALKFFLQEGEIGPFLERVGLKLVNHLNNEEIERQYLLKEDGSLLGQIIGHMRFTSAAPIHS